MFYDLNIEGHVKSFRWRLKEWIGLKVQGNILLLGKSQFWRMMVYLFFFCYCAGPCISPLSQNIFAGTEAAAVQNYKFPLTFLIFHVFPAQNNMQKFLVKNLFSRSFVQNSYDLKSEWNKWKVTCGSLNSSRSSAALVDLITCALWLK